MARKKRRFEQLEAAAATPTEKKTFSDPLKQKVENRLEDVGKRFEGKGKTILYAVGALVVVLLLIFLFMRWNRSTNAAAQTALGKAIETSTATVSEAPPAPGAVGKTYKTEKERAEAAIAEFQTVVDKFGGAAAEKAKYFIAVNKLSVDRDAGIQELESMSESTSDAGKLAKYALAQTRVGDNRLDEAVTLYQSLIAMDNAVITKDTLNFELAEVYEKQDKTQEAADIYFNIAKTASEAKDADGKTVAFSQAAAKSKENLQKIDPERAKQIIEPASSSPMGGGAAPFNIEQ